MIFAYIAFVLGVAAWFLPEQVQVLALMAVLVCGALFIRAMNRRARRDAQ